MVGPFYVEILRLYPLRTYELAEIFETFSKIKRECTCIRPRFFGQTSMFLELSVYVLKARPLIMSIV